METYGDVIKIAVEKEDRSRWGGMGKGDDSQKWNSCAALAMPVSFYVTSNRNHPVHGIDTIRVGKEKEEPLLLLLVFDPREQLAAKKILEYLLKADSIQEEYQSVISVMCKLSEDEESIVRSELVQQIPSIALYCQNNSDLKLVISQQLVPYTVKLLNDSHLSVRKLAQTALLVLLENNLIGQLQLSEWICPLVSQLAMCASNLDEQRIEDVTVMSMMIPLVDQSLALKYFMDPYISLCSDRALGIRTVCAMRFGTLCKIAGTETTESSLLSAFLELCKDVAWGVRKACANVFVDVTNVVSLKTRKEVLAKALLKLLDDSSNYVMLAAYQSLGGFICSFADPSRTGFVCEDGKLNILTPEEGNKTKINNDVNVLKSSEINCANHFEQDVSHQTSDMVLSEDKSHLSEDNSQSLLNDNCESSVESQTKISVNSHPLPVVPVENNVSSCTDNESVFNNFQYWRTPLPEVDVTVDEEMTDVHSSTGVDDNLILSDLSYTIKIRSDSDTVSSRTENQTFTNNLTLSGRKFYICNKGFSNVSYKSLEDETDKKCSVGESLLAFKSCDDIAIDGSTDWNNDVCVPFKRRNSSLTMPNDLIQDQDIVPYEILLKYFEALMAKSSMIPDEFNAACAFSFPAVTYTLGRKYWPCLRATFQRVTRNIQSFSEWRNRCAIASSLPQLASMLGHDIIMEDLLPKFLEFLTDVDEVRQSVVLQIPDFLCHVPSEERCQFFVYIKDFLGEADSMKWRFRCSVAEQLSATLKLCNPHSIEKYFVPVALTLLQDKVSSVRLAAAEFMANIIKNVLDDTKLNLLSKLDVTYRQAHKWNHRQMYVFVCEQLAKKRSVSVDAYVEQIVPKLFSLAWDIVPNVRLALSRCIALTLLPLGE
ncbi:hypothetical protein TNCT_717381 [Trichonephila clavata]|uniref:Serine/threonine-protein phosphatase 4 regulatory subunit 1 n=1 Tax=Trichonephila clavata TaxID=2740835 RepID=A0A8X6FJA4_TRICU|nr:hypothetical protein TNCT_717381 [Trichonephila clavata]